MQLFLYLFMVFVLIIFALLSQFYTAAAFLLMGAFVAINYSSKNKVTKFDRLIDENF